MMVRTRRLAEARESSPSVPPASEVDSLRRGLEILRLLDGKPLQASDIMLHQALPRATIDKLIATLAACRFVRIDQRTGALEADVACVSLGRAAKRGLPIVPLALPLMRTISQRYGVHLSLSTRDRLHMLVVEHCSPVRQVRLRLSTGARVPMATSASGRAYLWAQPEDRRLALLTEIANGQEMLVRPAMLAAFKELDTHGWTYLNAALGLQTGAVAVPLQLHGSPGWAVAAVATGSGSRKLLETRVAPELLEMALRIAAEHPLSSA